MQIKNIKKKLTTINLSIIILELSRNIAVETHHHRGPKGAQIFPIKYSVANVYAYF